MKPVILAIESSCDETAAAVCAGGKILSNIIATQAVHAEWGGVVPELASRAHIQQIVPTVDAALQKAGVKKTDLDAIAFTQAPGLIGSLLVGAQFAKGLALALDKPLIAVHHMQAHVLANLLIEPAPPFPFLCLTVSGGHTQIVLARSPLDLQVLGTTIDDAAGEAFDKVAKLLHLPYPGGPMVDKLAKDGDASRYAFATPQAPGLDFSFSGLKTSVLYFLQKETAKNPDFIAQNAADLCASVQATIISMLLKKFSAAAESIGIKHLCIAGGVSANSGLRAAFEAMGRDRGWLTYIPPFAYCTDNAAMIAITSHYKYEAGEFAPPDVVPLAKASW